MLSQKTSTLDTIFYRVRPGDNLGKIIHHYFGKVSLQQQKFIINQIQADNPEITNPNLIYPGQALVIDIPVKSTPTPLTQPAPVIHANKNTIKPLQQQWKKSTPQEKELLSALAPVMLGTGTAGMMMLDTTFKTNAPLVAEMAENYNAYKENKMTKGQYDYRRQKLLSNLKSRLGPTKHLLNGNKSANEILRISRSKGSSPTVNISRQINKMNTLSKIASRGGIVLSVAGLGVACHQIANTANTQEKNEILVESMGGFAGGLAYGAAASLVIMIMATPVGWVGALVIGIGGAAISYGTGQASKKLYTTYGSHINLANISNVNNVCR